MVAESDDALMEIFFESGDIPHDKMVAGLHKAFIERKIFPVVLASAIKAIGMRSILDVAVDLLPASSERAPREGVGARHGGTRHAPARLQGSRVGLRLQDDRGPVRGPAVDLPRHLRNAQGRLVASRTSGAGSPSGWAP